MDHQSTFGVTMKVLSCLPPGTLKDRITTVLTARQIELETVSAKACMQFARLVQYEAVLLKADRENYGDVLSLIGVLRHEQPNAALFVFERQLDLHQRLQLFGVGIDDCIGEPFSFREVAIRLSISIKLRQAASSPAVSKTNVNVLRLDELEIDLVRRIVTRMGERIDLRPKEFLLLEYLVRNANRSVTRAMILKHVWDASFEGMTNVVDVYISSLRCKLDQGCPQKLIQTIRGYGYRLTSGTGWQPVDGVKPARIYRQPPQGCVIKPDTKQDP